MTIPELIKKLADSGDQVYSKVCKVISVDITERTCEVEPLSGGANIPGCRLQAAIEQTSGFMLVPAVDSFVVVTWLNKNAAFVSMCSDLDEIQLNGDQYGGLVIIDKLKAEIDKNSQFLDSLKQILDSWAPVPNDGGAALKTAWTAISSTLQTADLSDITNDTVKHG
jgi:hypothetical protein